MSKIILIFLILIPVSALSHPLDLGYLEILMNKNNVELSLELNPTAVAEISQLSRPLTNSEQISSNEKIIFSSTLGASQIHLGETPCPWRNSQVQWINEQLIKISGIAHCEDVEKKDSHQYEFDVQFLTQVLPTFQLMTKIVSSGAEQTMLLSPQNTSLQFLGNESNQRGFIQFVTMGVHHIGAMPSEWMSDTGLHFPAGIDHILFLIVLIIGGGSFINIVKTVTGFTLGHSFTLAIGAFGWIAIPERIIESAIALSIVYVAYEAFIRKKSKNQWVAATLFGLVHGLGFAGAMQELDLKTESLFKALVGFNVGVELGQIIIVSISLPLLALSQRRPSFHHVTTRGFSAMVGIAGSYWFLIRAFG